LPSEGSLWDGRIIAVAKPAGISSFKVVSRIRHACKIKRVGHAGTLDPFAEGVLVIGIGRTATRQLGDLMRGDKEYLAEVVLGVTTDSGDLTGNIIARSDLPMPTTEAISSTLDNFRGEIEQIPPMYSALKIGGERLYKLARKGEIVERKARPAFIHELELVRVNEDGFVIRVVCGHGTYIRTLAEDIGNSLGLGAHLRSLVRTRVGEFKLEGAWDLGKLTEVMSAGMVAN